MCENIIIVYAFGITILVMEVIIFISLNRKTKEKFKRKSLTANGMKKYEFQNDKIEVQMKKGPKGLEYINLEKSHLSDLDDINLPKIIKSELQRIYPDLYEKTDKSDAELEENINMEDEAEKPEIEEGTKVDEEQVDKTKKRDKIERDMSKLTLEDKQDFVEVFDSHTEEKFIDFNKTIKKHQPVEDRLIGYIKEDEEFRERFLLYVRNYISRCDKVHFSEMERDDLFIIDIDEPLFLCMTYSLGALLQKGKMGLIKDVKLKYYKDYIKRLDVDVKKEKKNDIIVYKLEDE